MSFAASTAPPTGSIPAENRRYRKGSGVAAALLIRNGIKVISQRDFRTLELLHQKLDRHHAANTTALDHHETEWYRAYFSEKREDSAQA